MMGGQFAVLSSNLDIYSNPWYTKNYYASLNRQKIKLCLLMSYTKVG